MAYERSVSEPEATACADSDSRSRGVPARPVRGSASERRRSVRYMYGVRWVLDAGRCKCGAPVYCELAVRTARVTLRAEPVDTELPEPVEPGPAMHGARCMVRDV